MASTVHTQNISPLVHPPPTPGSRKTPWISSDQRKWGAISSFEHLFDTGHYARFHERKPWAKYWHSTHIPAPFCFVLLSTQAWLIWAWKLVHVSLMPRSPSPPGNVEHPLCGEENQSQGCTGPEQEYLRRSGQTEPDFWACSTSGFLKSVTASIMYWILRLESTLGLHWDDH